MARFLKDRLKFDLARNRRELLKVVAGIDDLTYAPEPGMKNYRAQLVEIGAMEAETVALFTTGQVPEWKLLESQVTGDTLEEVLGSLTQIREELFNCLDSLSEEQLHEAVDVPAEWESFVGDTNLEREEMFRWLTQHEYYHLGQIIAFRWIQGFNPYKAT